MLDCLENTFSAISLLVEFSSDHHQTWSTWSNDTEDVKLQRDFSYLECLAIVRLQIYGEEGKQEVCYNVFRMRR